MGLAISGSTEKIIPSGIDSMEASGKLTSPGIKSGSSGKVIVSGLVVVAVVVEVEMVVDCGCKITMVGVTYPAVIGPFVNPSFGMIMAPVVVTTEACVVAIVGLILLGTV